MKIEVDARGELCPKPVIMTKKELDKLDEGTITAIVDNEVAKDNISKLATGMGLKFTINQSVDEDYYIHISKTSSLEIEGDTKEVLTCIPNIFKDLTIAINSDKMGEGNDELGRVLIKSLMYTIRETTPWPSTIVLYNGGVKLTCEGSEVLDDLKAMEAEGVEILSCGTCLDYNNLKDKLVVGGITNMYNIYEKMRNSNNTITI